MKLPIFRKPAVPHRYRFNTSLMCGGCVLELEKVFEGDAKISRWEVSLIQKPLVLEITSMYTVEQVQALVKKAGYTADLIEELPLDAPKRK
jgi:hypothetical protein